MTSFVESLFTLKNKTAIVTGASKGIGYEIAEAFAKAGANVFGIGRSLKPSKMATFQYRSCDVTKKADFIKFCQEVGGKNGIHILLNAAGVTMAGPEATFKTNTLAPFDTIEVVAEYMKKQKNGSIINVTSIAAEVALPGNPEYGASKAGLKMLSKCFANDLAPFGIRVNNLAPGYIHTDMTTKSFNDKKAYQKRLNNMMLDRWGETKDLIGAAIFLASDASSYMTASDLIVDGGWTAKGLV